MAMRVTITREEIEGDNLNQRRVVIERRDYDVGIKQTVDLAANVKTEIPVPSGFEIQHIYLEPTDVAIQVYHDGSSQYWEVEQAFMAFDISITQLELYAASATTAYLWLGGT